MKSNFISGRRHDTIFKCKVPVVKVQNDSISDSLFQHFEFENVVATTSETSFDFIV